MSSEFGESRREEVGLDKLNPLELLNENQALKDLLKEGSYKITLTQESSHHGPLPPPEQLRDYESICPGFTKHLLGHMDREQTFRHTVMREGQKEVKRVNTASIWLAFTAPSVTLLVCVITLTLGFILIREGHDTGGITSMFVGLSAFAGVVIKSLLSRNSKPENEKDSADEDSG